MNGPLTTPTTETNMASYWIGQLQISSSKSVDAILTNARVVFEAEANLAEDQRKEFRRKCGLHRSDLSKLKIIGEHATELRENSDNLPPSTSSLYLIAKNPSLLSTVKTKSLRSLSRGEIAKCSAPLNRAEEWTGLVSIKIRADSSDAEREELAIKVREYVKEIDKEGLLECTSPHSPSRRFSPVKRALANSAAELALS